MKNKLKKKEKFFWEKHFGISWGDLPHMDPVVDRLNYSDSDFDDEDAYWISRRIKAVRRFDLKESEITDEGVQYLSEMAIQELALKNCKVTAAVIPHLNKMETLTRLHLKGTQIKLNDMYELTNLKCLECIIIDSDEERGVIIEQASLLHFLHFPKCEFIVNGSGYFSHAWH